MTRLVFDPVPQLVLRAGLSWLFAWAAIHKLRDVDSFRAALEGYDLVPPLWTIPAGAFLIAAEVGIATGLWLPRVHPVAGGAAAALLLLYAGAVAINLVRGRRDIDCGCAGPARRQTISGALVLRNAVLAAAALISALPAEARTLTWIDGVTLVAAILTVGLLYAAIDHLLAIAAAHRDASLHDDRAEMAHD